MKMLNARKVKHAGVTGTPPEEFILLVMEDVTLKQNVQDDK
jgi:hypothetical protein